MQELSLSVAKLDRDAQAIVGSIAGSLASIALSWRGGLAQLHAAQQLADMAQQLRAK